MCEMSPRYHNIWHWTSCCKATVWASNYTPLKLWGVITHPDDPGITLLNLAHGWVITNICWTHFLIHEWNKFYMPVPIMSSPVVNLCSSGQLCCGQCVIPFDWRQTFFEGWVMVSTLATTVGSERCLRFRGHEFEITPQLLKQLTHTWHSHKENIKAPYY